jgi:hypothetical protein
MKKLLSLALVIVILSSTFMLASCDILDFLSKTRVERENGEKLEVLNLVQTAEKNENFLDTEVTWYDDTFNYYVYNIGRIKNVPLTTTYSVFTYDGANLSYEKSITKASEKSIETTTQQAITKTVETSTTSEVSIKGTVGASYLELVSASVEAGYSSATTNSSSYQDVWSQTYRECVTESESETNTIQITFDSSCEHGNYMYLYLGNVKVYYVVMQSRKNPSDYYIETFNSIESHRYALVYTGENDEFPIDTKSKIQIDPSFIANLKQPANYIEGLKPEQMLLPVTGEASKSDSTSIKGYYTYHTGIKLEDLAEYYAQGYNKVEITYEFYATAERALMSNDPLNVDVYLSSNQKKENGFHSQSTTAAVTGSWIRGTATTDAKWLIDNEVVYLSIFNNYYNLILERKLTVNKITISYKIYRE